jgi:hypothetical protein
MPRDLMTIRLDRSTRRRLSVVARKRGRTASEVARAALDSWLEGEEGQAGANPYLAIADLIGCVRGGDPGRSTRGAAFIAKTLRRRAAKPARGR